jgi:hypothetical protein
MLAIDLRNVPRYFSDPRATKHGSSAPSTLATYLVVLVTKSNDSGSSAPSIISITPRRCKISLRWSSQPRIASSCITTRLNQQGKISPCSSIILALTHLLPHIPLQIQQFRGEFDLCESHQGSMGKSFPFETLLDEILQASRIEFEHFIYSYHRPGHWMGRQSWSDEVGLVIHGDKTINSLSLVRLPWNHGFEIARSSIRQVGCEIFTAILKTGADDSVDDQLSVVRLIERLSSREVAATQRVWVSSIYFFIDRVDAVTLEMFHRDSIILGLEVDSFEVVADT